MPRISDQISAILTVIIIYSAFGAMAGQEKLDFTKNISNSIWGWLVEMFNKSYVESYDKNMDRSNPPFSIALVELDSRKTQGGNPEELFVLWNDSGWCGSGGCALDLYKFNPEKWKWVQIGAFQGGEKTKVEIDDKSFNYMRVIWVDSYRYRWNGMMYDEN